MTPIAPAATVVLVREQADGLGVFLVQRHGGAGFMPNMWVFPGGRVEASDALVPADRVLGGRVAIERFGFEEDVGRATLVGALRETFEEAGIWLGHDAPGVDARTRLVEGRHTLAEVLAEGSSRLDLDRLVPWARWITPEGERRRFDTAFVLAVAQPDVEGLHDARETVASGWFRPADVLDAGLARMGLAPPTWWALRELAELRDLDAVLAHAAARDVSPVRPLLSMTSDGFGITLPGHAAHPEPRRPGLPTRIGMTPEGAWAAEP